MAVKKLTTPERFVGASTDTKPTDGATSVRPGATFLEYDTGVWFITYDGTNWVPKLDPVSGVQKVVSVTKACASATAYHAEDVLSESATVGTAWTFSAIARANGANGYITKAQVICETTAVTPRLTLFLFNAAQTGAVNDHAANTAPVHADEATYIGKIDFPAMEDLGTGDSITVATPSTFGNLPLAFTCASGADDLIGVLVTRDVFTNTATNDIIVKLTVEQ